MLISYSHKFIFFHVTKTAGTIAKKALKDYVTEPDKFKIKRPPKERKVNPISYMNYGNLLCGMRK